MNQKRILLGGGLVAVGAAVLLFPIVTIGYSKFLAESLRQEADTKLSAQFDSPVNTNASYNTGLYPAAAPKLSDHLPKGTVIGKLIIPSLKIEEGIIEGTDQSELAKAPGHLPDSVLPGQVGNSIIAAHNATTFRKIDRLTPGTTFTIMTQQGVFTFSVTGQRILHVTDALPDTAYPAVSLETCYPLDALSLTDKRLFVEAALVKSVLLDRGEEIPDRG